MLRSDGDCNDPAKLRAHCGLGSPKSRAVIRSF